MTEINTKLFWDIVRMGGAIIDDLSCIDKGTRAAIDEIRAFSGCEEKDYYEFDRWDNDLIRALCAVFYDAERLGDDCYGSHGGHEHDGWTLAHTEYAREILKTLTVLCEKYGLHPPHSAYDLDISKDRQKVAEDALNALTDEEYKSVLRQSHREKCNDFDLHRLFDPAPSIIKPRL